MSEEKTYINKPEDCQHMVFMCNAKMTRLAESETSEKIVGYRADIKVHCGECGQPFEWIGLPGGFNPAFPTVSLDGFEMWAPIRPGNAPVERVEGKVYN